jgi:hypothetical protein
MYFLSSFKRKIEANGKEVTVEGKQGTVAWLQEQDHCGENIGDTDTHVLFVEIKGSTKTKNEEGVIGPTL